MTHEQLEDVVVQMRDQLKKTRADIARLDRVQLSQKNRIDSLETKLQETRRANGIFDDIFKQGKSANG